MPSLSLSERAQALLWLRSTPSSRWPEGGQQPQLHLLSDDESVAQAEQLILEWEASGYRFLTLLDDDYPVRLRRASSPPAFLFVRGQLLPKDRIAVAIIGTRNCTDAGRRRALKLSRALAESGITVASGLALGIDTAAHQGALAAAGGRTLAIIGTGLKTIYPPENRDLHERIAAGGGAVLSQFWPDFKALKGGANFLARNRTMADLALATVVVEASFRSGARSQAVHAQKSGGTVMLLRSLVEQEEWARDMSERPGCSIVSDVADVLDRLDLGGLRAP